MHDAKDDRCTVVAFDDADYGYDAASFDLPATLDGAEVLITYEIR